MTATQQRAGCTVTRPGNITWLCDACSRPIKPTTGYLTVDRGGAMQQHRDVQEREDKRWEKARAEGHNFVVTSASEMLDTPSRVPWQALHRRCDRDPDRDDYWLEVERVDTLAKLLNWTAHLSGKNWLGDTDWARLLRAVAAAAGGADA